MTKNKKTVEPGISDFKNIIENNHYFVDKTAFIYDFFDTTDVFLRTENNILHPMSLV